MGRSGGYNRCRSAITATVLVTFACCVFSREEEEADLREEAEPECVKDPPPRMRSEESGALLVSTGSRIDDDNNGEVMRPLDIDAP